MQVNITKRIETSEGKRYCPVVVGPNGRIKPDAVMVGIPHSTGGRDRARGNSTIPKGQGKDKPGAKWRKMRTPR